MFNEDLVRSICQEAAVESDLSIVRELNSFLLSAFRDNHEEVRLRIAYLAKAYGITFDESKGPRAILSSRSEPAAAARLGLVFPIRRLWRQP
jgi:hypothetical protein